VSTAQRSAEAHTTELRLVDEQLANEERRLHAEVDVCPGPTRAALHASPADRLRDSIRLRASGDSQRQARVANQALADWYVRRARQTGNAAQCPRPALRSPANSNRYPGAALETIPGDDGDARPATRATSSNPLPPSKASRLRSGRTDTVHAPSPLPEYLG
jgi:hypothetical protein